jgi:hypothetical protein
MSGAMGLAFERYVPIVVVALNGNSQIQYFNVTFPKLLPTLFKE